MLTDGEKGERGKNEVLADGPKRVRVYDELAISSALVKRQDPSLEKHCTGERNSRRWSVGAQHRGLAQGRGLDATLAKCIIKA